MCKLISKNLWLTGLRCSAAQAMESLAWNRQRQKHLFLLCCGTKTKPQQKNEGKAIIFIPFRFLLPILITMSAFETDPLSWTEEWDEDNQCYFYYHAASGESSWERPAGLPESEEFKEFNKPTSEQTTADYTVEITSEVAEEASQWTVGWDETYQAEFFYNTVTEETVWDKPACLVALQSQEDVTVDETDETTQAASSNPDNWTVEWDSSYNCDFYFNTVTEESSWEKPACLGSKEVVNEESQGNEQQNEDEKEDVVEDQKVEEVKKEDEKEQKEEEVDAVTTSISEVKVAPMLPKKPPFRQNSILRRPSARPDMLGLRLSVPPPPVAPSPLAPPTTTTTTTTASTLPATTTSKRRQSVAPRPSAPAPTLKAVAEEVHVVAPGKFRSRMSSVFANIDDDSNMLIEGDDEEEDEDSTDQKLRPDDAISDVYLNALRGNSVRNLDSDAGLETKKEKPRAIGTYLMKKSPAMMKSWQKRYVVLKDGQLKYYANVSLIIFKYSHCYYYCCMFILRYALYNCISLSDNIFPCSQKEDYEGEKTPKGDINIMQIPAENVDKSIYLTGSAKCEIHIRMKGDETADKKSKASKDRLLVLLAIDEESAIAWIDILKDWVKYLNLA